MSLWFSIIVVVILILIPTIGSSSAALQSLFGIVIPYAAIITFLAGFVYRVLNWAKSPVPFRITTTCGQQKSLPWIKNSKLEAPHNAWGVVRRMALEIFFFRSLFRNTKVELRDGPRLVYGSSKWLWAAGLAFHYSFLVIFIRHFKYFVEPIPGWVSLVQSLDAFFQIGLPVIFLTDAVILASVGYLFFRRLCDDKIRYISHAADYFPLLLILSIATTGILMRYFFKVDIVNVKQLGTGLLSFNPHLPQGIGPLFYVHLFLVCTLIAYFPFSKLMHLGGVFLSPTRNLANNNRMKRHQNVWNFPVKMHTYDEYEEEFHKVMKAADIPLDKE
ncbi:MAG: sulfate reduction electron transfer complex DsrMKJOP subunit DsrM [bacterium]|nr:sulfate reduction electron transfer complex DsrMKJOP subunit DsrM [bacterium]